MPRHGNQTIYKSHLCNIRPYWVHQWPNESLINRVLLIQKHLYGKDRVLLILLGRLPSSIQIYHSQEEVSFNKRIKDIELLDLYNLELTAIIKTIIIIFIISQDLIIANNRILAIIRSCDIMNIMSKFFQNIITLDPLLANRILRLKSLTWMLFSRKFDNAYSLDFHKKKV